MPSQNKKPSLYLYSLPAIIISAFLALSIVFAWTEPTTAPPGGNVASPVNIGDIAQIKSGPLQVNGFRNIGTTVLDGNVGIGTTSPGAKLDITSSTGRQLKTGGWADMSSSGSGYGLFGGNMYQDYSPTDFKYANTHASIGAVGFATNYPGWNKASVITSGTTNSTAGVSFTPTVIATFQSNGYVGIGTTAPGAKLEVVGTARMTGFQLGTSATAGHVLTANTSGVGTWQALPSGGTGSLPSGTSGQTLRHDGTNWVANSNIFNDGTNVGIRTISPAITLAIGDTDTGLNWISDGNLAVYTNNAERLRITSAGNVGIGTTSPIEKLHVAGYVRGDSGLCIGADCRAYWPSGIGSVGGADNFIPRWNETAFLENSVIYQTDGGNVGIATMTPQYSLDVSGTLRAININLGGVTRNTWPAGSGIVMRGDLYGAQCNAGWQNVTADCPVGYVRTGCSGFCSNCFWNGNTNYKYFGAASSGERRCSAEAYSGVNGLCLAVEAYCMKVE